MLNAINTKERENSLELFESFATKIYGEDVGQCLAENWDCLLPWHFGLIEHLRTKPLINKAKVL
jgi:hypothetical protein